MPAMTRNAAFWLAGTAAAHCVAEIHQGERLTPLLGHVDRWNEISLLRITGRRVSFTELLSDRYAVNHVEALRLGRRQLDAEPPAGAHGAVFATDQILDVDERSMRVILLEIRAYCEPTSACTMVIPYRRAGEAQGFGVHRPTVIEVSNVSAEAFDFMMGSFFAGMESHRTGSTIWTASAERELDAFYAA